MLALDHNAYGCPVLTVRKARQLLMTGASVGQWYIAKFAQGWTVGLLHNGIQYHLLHDYGEPVQFGFDWDAWQYLRRVLKVPDCEMPELDWDGLGYLGEGASPPSLITAEPRVN